MTKVLFVYPYAGEGFGGFQYGIAYISSLLKRHGHETFLVRMNVDKAKGNDLIRKIREINPDIIGFSFVTNHYPFVKLCAKWIKEEFDIPIVCGGVHTTISPDEVILDKNVDMICVGEGEYPMLELSNNIEKGMNIKNVKNIWFKDKRNPLRSLISNLDELPFPDRELFGFSGLLRESGGVAGFMAGRGCPFDCTYCCNHILKEILYEGRYVRLRSVENVLSEIREVTEKYDVRKIVFHDDTFTLSHKWVKNFGAKYKENFDIKFTCQARVETINKELLISLKEAGCEYIQVGVESGNEWLRKNVLKRQATNEQILNAFKMIRKVGIKIATYYMIGLPYETPEMVEETIKFNETLSPDRFQISIFYPYPGTMLWRTCKKEGFLSGRDTSSYFDDSILDLPKITRGQIKAYYKVFYNQAIDTEIRSFLESHSALFSKIFEKFGKLLNSSTKKLLIDVVKKAMG